MDGFNIIFLIVAIPNYIVKLIIIVRLITPAGDRKRGIRFLYLKMDEEFILVINLLLKLDQYSIGTAIPVALQ